MIIEEFENLPIENTRCKCKEMLSVDGYFAYTISCPACKKIYYCHPEIELIELTDDAIENAIEADY